MAVSEVSIANQALGWLGANLITSLDDEQVEAQLIKANYDQLRDAVMEDHAWTFANARSVLTPTVEEPEFGTTQRFLIRPDTIRVLRVEDSENAFGTLRWSLEQRHIIANVEKIFVFYTTRITDPALFSPAYVQALAQRLAADLAIPLTESGKLMERHWALYREKIQAAAATDGMQGINQQITSTRLLRSRTGFFTESGGFAIGDPLTGV